MLVQWSISLCTSNWPLNHRHGRPVVSGPDVAASTLPDSQSFYPEDAQFKDGADVLLGEVT